MRLGLQLNSFDWNGGPERFARTLANIARAAEEAGFDRIGVADHFWQHPIMGGPEVDEPECYTTALDTLPDVALLDIEMPGGDGLGAAAALKENLPSCRVIILTTFGRAGYLKRAMESGAVGFLLKDAPASGLASAVRRVMNGERVVDPGLAAAALSEGESPLTGREREVLSASANGATIEDVAAKLYLSEGTVRNYLSTAIKKLGARNRVEAARLAERKGWL